MKKIILRLGLCLSVLFITGCWDRKELNEQAIWIGSGWDVAKNGGIEVSGQIVIPSNIQTQGGGGGTMQKGFFTISAIGKNLTDALQNIQTKLPRQALAGQRRVMIFGEPFARRGIKRELDNNQRRAEVNLRTDVFVIKGATAKKALSVSNPLEKPPITAPLGEHEQSGGRGNTAYLDLLMAATSDGLRPSIPVLEFSSTQGGKRKDKESANPPLLRIAGVAIFDKNLKMQGILNMEEYRDVLWVMGIQKFLAIGVKKEDVNASLTVDKLSSKIEPHISKNQQITFTITLKGDGSLKENNSGLDVRNPKNLKQLEKEFEKTSQKQVQQMVTKVQKEYGLDIFGLGEVIHRKNPNKWKLLKHDWDKKFSEATILVKTDLRIKEIGMDGPSLLYKESEIKR